MIEVRKDSPKHIFVTGGVVSSLGKGITASSLGMLLQSRGIRVAIQKLDPYLNVDCGTMNPFQHGEVFVTEDGSETDLDIGHYERFLDIELDGLANTTTGQVYSSVISKERHGDFLGSTVQVIPHVTDEIIRRMRAQAEVVDGVSEIDLATDRTVNNGTSLANSLPEVIITEIGGTVGDIESLPFLEAARQVRRALGRDNCIFVHVSLLPYLSSASEIKTKPTQHSVSELRSAGISPDVLVLRSKSEVSDSIKKKCALTCDVDYSAIAVCPDVVSIYDVPRVLHEQNLDEYVAKRLGLSYSEPNWGKWQQLLDTITHPSREVTVAIVGKYVDLPDAYLSVIEAVQAAGYHYRTKVNLRWVASDECTSSSATASLLAATNAVIVPGGFGVRGVEGKLQALRYARENRIPTLGLCLGLQCMVIEAAQNLCGISGADSTEFNPKCTDPVVALLDSQQNIVTQGDLGGSMRLGSYPAVLKQGSLVHRLYSKLRVSERHRHRFEVNLDYEDALAQAGLRVSGTSPDGKLVEFVELDQDQHPYYVSTQAHPEFKSRPTRAHPLFLGLISAALEQQQHSPSP